MPLLRQLLPPAILLQTYFAEHALPVRLDRGELELMLLNLAANARDAIPGSGELLISTGLRDGFAQVRVRDSGPGVPAELAERIFEPFFSTKLDCAGAGLGLSMARRLVRSLGGDVELAATDRASEFVLSFPLRAPVQGRPAAPIRST